MPDPGTSGFLCLSSEQTLSNSLSENRPWDSPWISGESWEMKASTHVIDEETGFCQGEDSCLGLPYWLAVSWICSLGLGTACPGAGGRFPGMGRDRRQEGSGEHISLWGRVPGELPAFRLPQDGVRLWTALQGPSGAVPAPVGCGLFCLCSHCTRGWPWVGQGPGFET